MTIKESFTDNVKIPLLKSKASGYYQAYYSALDKLSCGATLAEEVSPAVYKNKIGFNETMDKLAKLDPTCPKSRL